VPRDENPKSPPSDLSDNDDLNESEDEDVRVEPDVPTVVLEPLNVVTVTVIPEATQAPPPPPAVTTVTLTTQVPNTVVVSFVVQRFSKMKQFVKQLK
ncbi:hypothetical protein Tco_0571960, partial [Tanacetum coccineum]